MCISISIFASVYLVVFFFFFNLLPPAVPVTDFTMNCNRLVMGLLCFLLLIPIYFFARKTYSGPLVEMEPLEQFFVYPSVYNHSNIRDSFPGELHLT